MYEMVGSKRTSRRNMAPLETKVEKVTYDLIARKGKRELTATVTGLEPHVMGLIDDLTTAGWVVAWSHVP